MHNASPLNQMFVDKNLVEIVTQIDLIFIRHRNIFRNSRVSHYDTKKKEVNILKRYTFPIDLVCASAINAVFLSLFFFLQCIEHSSPASNPKIHVMSI